MDTVGRLLPLMVMVIATCITPGKYNHFPGAPCKYEVPKFLVPFQCLLYVGILYCHVYLYCCLNNQHVEYISWCYLNCDGLIDRMMYLSVFILCSLTPTIDVNIGEISFITFKFVTFSITSIF